ERVALRRALLLGPADDLVDHEAFVLARLVLERAARGPLVLVHREDAHRKALETRHELERRLAELSAAQRRAFVDVETNAFAGDFELFDLGRRDRFAIEEDELLVVRAVPIDPHERRTRADESTPSKRIDRHAPWLDGELEVLGVTKPAHHAIAERELHLRAR